MINKEELLNKIEEEMGKWQNYYQQIDIHIYSIIGTCFRAQAEFQEDETKKVDRTIIFDAISDYIMNIEDDVECLNAIFNTVMNTFSDIAIPFLTELNKGGEQKGAKLATLTPEQALMDIGDELVARSKINDESLISLRTLQWVKNIITNQKEEA